MIGIRHFWRSLLRFTGVSEAKTGVRPIDSVGALGVPERLMSQSDQPSRHRSTTWTGLAASVFGFAGLVIAFAGFGQAEEADGAQKEKVSPGLTVRAKSPSDAEREALELSLEQAMWTALAFENAAQLRAILKRGADPNQREQLSEMTPLMAAETAALTNVLLEAGADPNQKDRIGQTALHHAVRAREAASIVRLLGQAGADINVRARDSGECTPLLCAVEHYTETKERKETATAIRILTHLGADLNAPDATGRTPLAIAASRNQPQLIHLLVELGADPQRPADNGRTPLELAHEADARDAIKALADASRGPKKRSAN